jgi:predicted RecA/RadA family phage recombinase
MGLGKPVGSVNITAGSAIAVGQLVALGSTMVGVAPSPIAAGAVGAISLEEQVVTGPKPTGAGTDYAQWSRLYLYNSQLVTGATGVLAGVCHKQPATTDTTVELLLLPGCGVRGT